MSAEVSTRAAEAECETPEPAATGQCLPPASEQELQERRARGPRNVSGESLATCSLDPITGFFRSGRCETGPQDRGVHVVCSEVNDAFLSYTRERGNDLSTPRGRFPGLKAGDRWCLCAARWEEARQAGVAPPVVLEATDVAALRIVSMETLQNHAAQTRPLTTASPSERVQTR